MTEQNSNTYNGSPKTFFSFGFVAGIALCGVLASGYLLSNDTPETNTGNEPTVVVEDGADDPAPTPAATAPKLTDADHVKGDGAVEVIEYTDIQCPYCSRHHPNMVKLLEEYGDQISYTVRHFPLTSIHPQAMNAAEAAECAADQGKYFEMVDILFANNTALSDSAYAAHAGTIGLDLTAFNACMDSDEKLDKVTSDMQSGSSSGVRGTPATFIGGVLVSGAQPYESLKAAVENAL